MTTRNIFLVGISASGKSTVGRLLAAHLGLPFIDSDARIQAAAGRTIPAIFKEEGEAAFRVREARALRAINEEGPAVVATGGGAVTSLDGRREIARGTSVWLDISPAEAAARLMADPSTEARPLLAGDPRGRLEALLDARRPLYELADMRVSVDGLAPAAAAEAIAAALQAHRPSPLTPRLDRLAALVTTPTASSRIFAGAGLLDAAGAICRAAGLTGRVFLISDENVGPLYAETLAASLSASGYAVSSKLIPSGEQSKNLATVSTLYDWLLGQRIERSDFIACLGGGVVTDLGGFVAASILRGVAFVHVPTTTLGMVDASIGGKTGVDHPLGKNAIGAFAQPRAVIMDTNTLASLPDRELREGWAEFVKHGFILDAALVDHIESLDLTREALSSPDVVAWSAGIKAAVVSGDEREAGQRTLLNYGHTFGHAIESVTGYTTYLHGEAVAIGMRAAGFLSVEMGLLSPAEFERQQRIIRKVGLPEHAPGLVIDDVLAATLSDKKVAGGKVKWVLLEALGRATTRSDVPPELVRRAAELILT